MTRKDELTARAQQIVSEMPVTWASDQERKGYDDYVRDMLQQVEREVLARTEKFLDDADHLGDVRNWLYGQQKELG